MALGDFLRKIINPRYLVTADDNIIVVKLMAADTEITNTDIQLSCDAQGRLNISETIVADIGDIELSVDDVEQYILDTLQHYKITDKDSGNATYDYFSFMDKGGAWYIMRADKTGATVAYRYVKDASGYNWGNRASETYGYFSVIF